MRGALTAFGIACALLSSTAGADDYHTCRMPDGRIEMRDTPCPGNARALPSKPAADRINVVPGPAPRTAAVSPAAPHPVKAAPFVDPDWDAGFFERMVLRARFGGVLSSLQRLRTASMVYNSERGGWPSRAEDLGLDGSNMQTRDIADVWFLRDGTILARLKPGFGEEKYVGMLPVEQLGGAELGWTCVANFPESFFAGSFGPGCESRTIAAPGPHPRPADAGPARGPASLLRPE